MNSGRNGSWLALAGLCGLFLAACGGGASNSPARSAGDDTSGKGAGPETGGGSSAPHDPAPSGGGTGGAAGTGSPPATGTMGSDTGGSGGSGGSSGPLPQSGQLTAGAWDDNVNFDFYQRYYKRETASPSPGLPAIPIADRLVLTVHDAAGHPAAGVTVSITSGTLELPALVTGADGRALIFPAWMGVASGAKVDFQARANGQVGSASAIVGEEKQVDLTVAQAEPVSGLDVALVIDTTGSMGDEIAYLQSEVLSISQAIAAEHPTLSQRWAVVPYKDYVDQWVTRPVDFTGDPQAYQTTLRGLSADGGGDYPEAPERALADMNKLGWRAGPVARVAFWIADAPHHAGREKEIVTALQDARARGIHLYPIAASGADDLTEFTMRLSALVSGGRYLFLTNDSGIGGDHKEPLIPCYLVTTLQRAMLRMISAEITGQVVDPLPTDVLRTGGNPMDGRCTLMDGNTVDLL